MDVTSFPSAPVVVASLPVIVIKIEGGTPGAGVGGQEKIPLHVMTTSGLVILLGVAEPEAI
ncbi:MAG: hypothetical protein AAB649_01580 [Patescibacteria group bacterium]